MFRPPTLSCSSSTPHLPRPCFKPSSAATVSIPQPACASIPQRIFASPALRTPATSLPPPRCRICALFPREPRFSPCSTPPEQTSSRPPSPPASASSAPHPRAPFIFPKPCPRPQSMLMCCLPASTLPRASPSISIPSALSAYRRAPRLPHTSCRFPSRPHKPYVSPRDASALDPVHALPPPLLPSTPFHSSSPTLLSSAH